MNNNALKVYLTDQVLSQDHQLLTYLDFGEEMSTHKNLASEYLEAGPWPSSRGSVSGEKKSDQNLIIQEDKETFN